MIADSYSAGKNCGIQDGFLDEENQFTVFGLQFSVYREKERRVRRIEPVIDRRDACPTV